MEVDFWHQVWRDDRIGFHAPEVNSFLRGESDRLGFGPGKRVFVPLCGMSRDMTWLAGRGADVVGVEISRVAIERYFRERGLDPEVDRVGEFERFRGGGVSIFCGDFFDIGAEETGEIDRFYDRAALIAMPPEMRPGYAAHLLSILGPQPEGMVVTLEHDRGSGPPFSVEQREVEQLFGSAGNVVRIASRSGSRGVISVAYLVGPGAGNSTTPGEDR